MLAILTPASRAAVESGHPEEMLAAALCVIALLVSDRRPLWAGVALGLALATKQWAVLAVSRFFFQLRAGGFFMWRWLR